MPGLMFDSDTPELLLEPTFAMCRVATYADLMTPDLLRQLAGRLVVIDRGLGDPMNLATVADVESGALSLAAAVERIHAWKAQGRPSVTIYHDRVHQADVDKATAGMGVWNWVATLDGTLLPDGQRRAVVQFAGETVTGLHADLSVVWNDSWHPLHTVLDGPQVQTVQHLIAQLPPIVNALSSAVKTLG